LERRLIRCQGSAFSSFFAAAEQMEPLAFTGSRAGQSSFREYFQNCLTAITHEYMHTYFQRQRQAHHHTQTHTDAHKHTQTHTHTHTQMHTHTNTHRCTHT